MDRALGNPLGNPLALPRIKSYGSAVGTLQRFPSAPDDKWASLREVRELPTSDYPELYERIGNSFFALSLQDREVGGTDDRWCAIAYGNGIFVATNRLSNAKSMTSSDGGLTWTSRTNLPSSAFWQTLAYGNGVFVALAADPGTTKAAVSADGLTWSAVSTVQGPGGGWSGVAYGNGIFLAVSGGSNSQGAKSVNGYTWQSSSTPSAPFSSIAFGNGVFVAQSEERTTTTTSGSVWTPLQTNEGIAVSIVYGNGQFVRVGTDYAAVSVDGITWETVPIPVGTWSSVTFGHGVFVVLSSTGKVATSVDGKNWVVLNDALSGSSTFIWENGKICYGGGSFVAVGNNSVFRDYYSEDVFALPKNYGDFYIRAKP